MTGCLQDVATVYKLDPPLPPPQLQPLGQMWSLLAPKIQDGDSNNAELEASKQMSTVGAVTVAMSIIFTVYDLSRGLT